MIKKGLLILLAVMIMTAPLTAQAKTLTRYTTQTVSLKDKPKGKTIYKVKRNTKLTVTMTGKNWCRVKYKGQKYSVKKRFLNPERVPGKKKARYYINYLRTKGPVHWHNRKYTYYTSRLCPIYLLPVPGLHLDSSGIWCDKNDYIVLGSSVANKVSRKVIATPFGKYGKVYDTGGYSTPDWLCDTAVDW